MSKESMMQFADSMVSRSAFLRENCPNLEEYSDPECPLPISLLGYFGAQIARRYDTIQSKEWVLLSALIEQGLSSNDDDVRTAVKTGLIEGLVHRAEGAKGLLSRIEVGLGSLARSYAEAYRNADFSVKT